MGAQPSKLLEVQILRRLQGFPSQNAQGLVSPDGMRLAQVTRDDEKYRVVIDGKNQGQAFARIDSESFRWSRDSKRVSFVADTSESAQVGTQVVFVDGLTSENLVSASPVVFSPDGKHVAYAAQAAVGQRTHVYLDGKASTADYWRVADMAFSEDSNHFAYVGVAKDTHKRFASESIDRAAIGQPWVIEIVAVVDGKLGGAFDKIMAGGVHMSADGKHTLYAGRRGKDWFAVVDGVESQPYLGIRKESLAVSSDGKRMAYAIKRPTKADFDYALVDNGVVGNGYRVISGVTLSADGKRLAYHAGVGYDSYNALAETDESDGRDFPIGKPIEVVDGKETEFGSGVVFSPDGARVAMTLLDFGGDPHRFPQDRVAIDGKNEPQLGGAIAQLQFSPDGKHYAYVITDGNSLANIIVLDGTAYGIRSTGKIGKISVKSDGSVAAVLLNPWDDKFGVVEAVLRATP